MKDSPDFDEQREKARELFGRIAFDCYNLKEVGDRAVCAKGYWLSRATDRGLSLVSVLMGVTPNICKVCKSFEGGD